MKLVTEMDEIMLPKLWEINVLLPPQHIPLAGNGMELIRFYRLERGKGNGQSSKSVCPVKTSVTFSWNFKVTFHGSLDIAPAVTIQRLKYEVTRGERPAVAFQLVARPTLPSCRKPSLDQSRLKIHTSDDVAIFYPLQTRGLFRSH